MSKLLIACLALALTPLPFPGQTPAAEASTIGRRVVQRLPTDGEVKAWTLMHKPVSNLEVDVFLNGLLLEEGYNADYLLADTRLMWMRSQAPAKTDKVIVKYRAK